MAIDLSEYAGALKSTPTSQSALAQLKACQNKLTELQNNITLSGTTPEYIKIAQKALDDYTNSIPTLFSSEQLSAISEISKHYGIEGASIGEILKDSSSRDLLSNLMDRDRIVSDIKEMTETANQCAKEKATNQSALDSAKNNIKRLENEIAKLEDKIDKAEDEFEELLPPDKDASTVVEELNQKNDELQELSEKGLDTKLEEETKKLLQSGVSEDKIFENLTEDCKQYAQLKQDVAQLEQDKAQWEKITDAGLKLQDLRGYSSEVDGDKYISDLQTDNLINFYYSLIEQKLKTASEKKKSNKYIDIKSAAADRSAAEMYSHVLYVIKKYQEEGLSYEEIQKKIKEGYNIAGDEMNNANEFYRDLVEKQKNGENFPSSNNANNDKTLAQLKGMLASEQAKASELSNSVNQFQNCIDSNKTNKLEEDLKEAQKKVEKHVEKREKELQAKNKKELNLEQNAYTTVNEINSAHSIYISNVLDIESTRYSATNYSNRVGYTLLSCGKYTENVYSRNTNNANIEDLKFILPLPDGTIDIDTSVTWNEKDEEGLNEATAAYHMRGDYKDKVISPSISKWIQKKALDIGGEYGMEGVMRGKGIAYNPNTQLYFENVSLSTPKFTFKLAPKSKEEAVKIKLFIEALNLLALPSNSWDYNIFDAISETISKFKNGGKGLFDNLGEDDIFTSLKKTFTTAIGAIPQLASWLAGKFTSIDGQETNLNAPFFSYPNLWNVAVYVTGTNSLKDSTPNDFLIVKYNKLALESVNTSIGSSNGITWHEDGFPTVIEVSLDFHETQYRTRENSQDLLQYLTNTSGTLVPTTRTYSAVETEINKQILEESQRQARNKARLNDNTV